MLPWWCWEFSSPHRFRYWWCWHQLTTITWLADLLYIRVHTWPAHFGMESLFCFYRTVPWWPSWARRVPCSLTDSGIAILHPLSKLWLPTAHNSLHTLQYLVGYLSQFPILLQLWIIVSFCPSIYVAYMPMLSYKVYIKFLHVNMLCMCTHLWLT